MNLKVIASGSGGNCYILQSPTSSLILECGVKLAEIQSALNYDFEGVLGCLVTHEHKDHCKSARELMRRGIDVCMTQDTAITALGLELDNHNLCIIKKNVPFYLGDWLIYPFEAKHDATEPVGYLIRYEPTGETLLFATDTYYIGNRFKGLNYICTECNYDKTLLDANVDNGEIPESLRNRILGSHFSVENVIEFLKANDMSEVMKIVLLHLSDNNSDAEDMRRQVWEATGINMVIAMAGESIKLEMCPF